MFNNKKKRDWHPMMIVRSSKRNLAMSVALLLTGGSTVAVAGKDMGPASACDGLAKGSPAWSACVGPATAQLSDEELFYAGYWMARLGNYETAIGYLSAAKAPDARTLTYLGFATRKSGDVAGAFPFYKKALSIDPDFVVARAYLGEALLTVGDSAAARGELNEIAKRCGANCAAYDELARHLAKHEGGRG